MKVYKESELVSVALCPECCSSNIEEFESKGKYYYFCLECQKEVKDNSENYVVPE